MITIDLDPAVSELTALFAHHERAVSRAVKRAHRKLVRWLHRQVLRQLSRETGATQKTLKAYRRVSLKLDGLQGELWFGLNPLPLHETGRVSWSPKRAGVRVRGRTYEGAFYRAVYGSQPKVWIRSARNPGYATYHPKRRYRPFSGRVSSGRFPVELLGAPLDEVADGIARELDSRLARRAERRFRELLEQELNYATRYET